jgi:membrane protein implicated in regulation of membrane protease activity
MFISFIVYLTFELVLLTFYLFAPAAQFVINQTILLAAFSTAMYVLYLLANLHLYYLDRAIKREKEEEKAKAQKSSSDSGG